MVKAKKFSRKNKVYVALVALSFVIVCTIIASVCFAYYRQVGTTVKEESEGYILEISKQMGKNVERNIHDNFSALESIKVSMSGNLSFEEFTQRVAYLQEYWEYSKLLLIDANAQSYDIRGNNVRLSNDEYLEHVIQSRESAMSTSQMIDDTECVVFAVPIDVKVGGIHILALASTYDLATFDTILSMNAFDEKGFAHIIRKNGNMVVRSSSENAFSTGYNLLNSLESMGAVDENILSRIRSEIRNGEEGFEEILINKNGYFMAYIELDEQLGAPDWRLLTFVPTAEVNSKSVLLLQLTLILSSGITFVFILFSILFFTVTFKNRRRLEQIAYVDSVTGGNTIQMFNELATKQLQSSSRTEYAILHTNIEKFKLLNEQFGKESCDIVLQCLYRGIANELDSDEVIGRLYADNFCILLKYTDMDTLNARIDHWKSWCSDHMKNVGMEYLHFIIEFGIYKVTDTSMPLNHIIDRAKLALAESASTMRGNIRVAVYDEQLRKAMVREKQLEDRMEIALENKEFCVYFQPKYLTQSESIGGAEALVRWQSPEGMIYPNEFIPLFEKNGFINELDFFVFETVCATLRRWMDEGKEPIKISFNCSRVQLKNLNFLDKYVELANRYDIPKKYLEIEFTENIVFNDVEYFTGIIKQIHSAGFGCSMDDFGSGYSSLSMIQDIPVDTIKLDKVFFRERSTETGQRTESVVGSIITMSKALAMTTVAEGVEERHQVDMLKKMDCDLIQGFYFARPMPIEQFEKLAFAFGKSDTTKEG